MNEFVFKANIIKIYLNYLVKKRNLCLIKASRGNANTHFLSPVNITELITKIAPIMENLFGISSKNNTCHMKA